MRGERLLSRLRRRKGGREGRLRGTEKKYIEAIGSIQERTGEDRACTNDIAEMLGVRPASVTEMLIKLEARGLVDHRAYHGASLTTAGRKAAAGIRERHPRISRFLELIGVPSEHAGCEAFQLEHNLKGDTVEQLVRFYEYLEGSRRGRALLKRFGSNRRQRAVKGGCPL
jgi:DtxR family Mn-dependent transcriptional regulator